MSSTQGIDAGLPVPSPCLRTVALSCFDVQVVRVGPAEGGELALVAGTTLFALASLTGGLAPNAGVPASLAGLAGAMITASFQVGGALGLAICSAASTARTTALLAAGTSRATALTGGFHRALLLAAAFVLAAAVVGAARGEHQGRADNRDHRDRGRRGDGPGPRPLAFIPNGFGLLPPANDPHVAGQTRRCWQGPPFLSRPAVPSQWPAGALRQLVPVRRTGGPRSRDRPRHPWSGSTNRSRRRRSPRSWCGWPRC